MPPKFNSHNVRMPDDSQTAYGLPFVSDCAPCKVGLYEMNSRFPEEARSQVTVADLGSLEGGYAVEFARHGYKVTGIEARSENHECALWLKENLPGLSLDFVMGDVRYQVQDRQFDVVFCSGLLYHLNKPVSFLKLLGEVTQQMLILNTHVSMPGDPETHKESAHHKGSGCDYTPAQNEGRWGHWYRESRTRWDSYGNTDSFWLRKDELFSVLREEAGFREVREIYWRHLIPKGDNAHVPGGAGNWADRIMAVAVKA